MCNKVKRKKNQRRIQKFLIRGVQTLVQKGLLNFFCCKLLLKETTT